ncbi:dihydroneopterin aldolase [Pseudoclavibacter sp. 13-3]|uniref:dihydroneopterin aldolase n=1 Tax=Pseudoclavibacter sp. 13-3 TaxID=2901228 RepID=UPI001E5357B9|nr:dihydroneopterin aldolase [Pseudoclavibacter sp. 13-3]MCD7101485.1 dihydroneopterin aldolase [Pseudoclavibacter sp. 13-3]
MSAEPAQTNAAERPDLIRLSGVRARGRHGVFPAERRDGQWFTVDAVLEVSTRVAGRSDRLEDTVDYGVAAELINARITGEPVDLIERLAELIAGDLLTLSGVQAVEVTVHKPQAPITVAFSDVTLTVRRQR